MRKNRMTTEGGTQLSLWSKFEELTDNQILSSITKKAETLDDDWSGYFRMEQIFNRLSPSARRVAESAIELYKRRDAAASRSRMLNSSEAAFEAIRTKIEDAPYEEFWIIGVNNRLKMIDTVRVSNGGLDTCAADIRKIFKSLLLMNATAFFCVHNHPSGHLKPSEPDKKITKMIREAGQVMGIRLMDHLIISSSGYFSFNDEGLM